MKLYTGMTADEIKAADFENPDKAWSHSAWVVHTSTLMSGVHSLLPVKRIYACYVSRRGSFVGRSDFDLHISILILALTVWVLGRLAG